MNEKHPSSRAPREFPLDDTRIYDAYIAGRQSAALAVAVRCSLFDRLAQEPRTLEALGQALGFEPRPLHSLLIALEAMGMVLRRGDLYDIPEDVATYLLRGRKGWLGGLIDMEVDHFLSPESLLRALQSNKSSVYGSEDPWEHHQQDPEQARQFTQAMHSVSARPSAALAEQSSLEGLGSLLDVGGGSGALSIAWCRHHPQRSATVFDLEEVCVLALEYIQEAGLANQISTHSGDMFSDPYPRGHEAILFSQILHDWSPEQGHQLLTQAFEALDPGGRVLIHEKLYDESSKLPLANALVNLDMLVWTEGQQYSRIQLEQMLSDIGFVSFSCEATTGYWSLIQGTKPRP